MERLVSLGARTVDVIAKSTNASVLRLSAGWCGPVLCGTGPAAV